MALRKSEITLPLSACLFAAEIMALRRKKGNLPIDQHDVTMDHNGMITTTVGCASDDHKTATFEDHLEVTHEQYLNTISIQALKESEINSRGGLRRFTKLLGNRSFNNCRDTTGVSAGRCRYPQREDNDENCDGNRSLSSAANFTVGSLETLKASNANRFDQIEKFEFVKRREESKNRWYALKRIIRVKTTPLKFEDSSNALQCQERTEQTIDKGYAGRQRAQTEDSRSGFIHDVRVRSAPHQVVSNNHCRSSSSLLSQSVRDIADDKIRGRLYGVDMLYLGDGRFTSSVATSVAPWDTPFVYTFTGQTPHWSPQRIVDEMLLSSSGRSVPEIMLDGYIPGPDGRWVVQVEIPRESGSISVATTDLNKSDSKTIRNRASDQLPVANRPTHCDECKSSQSSTPSIRLQHMVWGSKIPSFHLTDSGSRSDEDMMQELASRCSIPIDTDNDSFLIATKEHIEAIHDIIGITLSKGQFADTCQILNFIIRGVTTVTDPDLRFFRGALLHNLGIIQMWQENTRRQAVLTIQNAINERQKMLPPKHPDLVASMARKGDACLALGDLKGAVCALESAVHLTSPEHLIRAKVLNNLGVAYYFDRGGKPALKEFMKSIAIQRSWLESTVRRETTVYDAVVTLCNMGKVHLELAEFDLSLHAYEEAVLLLTSVFSKDHDMVLSCLSSLAVAKSQKGDLGHGLQILQGCLRSQNNRFGEMSAASIETVGLIGYLHAKKGEFGAALRHLSVVRKWQKINLSPQHQSSLRTKDSIKLLENKLGIVRTPSVAKVWV